MAKQPTKEKITEVRADGEMDDHFSYGIRRAKHVLSGGGGGKAVHKCVYSTAERKRHSWCLGEIGGKCQVVHLGS